MRVCIDSDYEEIMRNKCFPNCNHSCFIHIVSFELELTSYRNETDRQHPPLDCIQPRVLSEMEEGLTIVSKLWRVPLTLATLALFAHWYCYDL
jgi:hypothetical protein